MPGCGQKMRIEPIEKKRVKMILLSFYRVRSETSLAADLIETALIRERHRAVGAGTFSLSVGECFGGSFSVVNLSLVSTPTAILTKYADT